MKLQLLQRVFQRMLTDIIDVSLSGNANLKALKDMGYKVGKNKVSELLNKKLSDMASIN